MFQFCFNYRNQTLFLSSLYHPFFEKNQDLAFHDFERLFDQAWDPVKNGHVPLWIQTLETMPKVSPSKIILNENTVSIGLESDMNSYELKQLEYSLKIFLPWRKGPFDFFGIHVDAEWQSWMKWRRILSQIQPLSGRRVLDVGCGNGYYVLRMLGEGAEQVVGIEPHVLYNMQFLTVQRYLNTDSAVIIPTTLEDFPKTKRKYDTVFSMGVLYHAKQPLDHLNRLATVVREGGQLILETLVVTDHPTDMLIPKNRYAQMRNVTCIPTLKITEAWLAKAGFKNIKLVDLNQTEFSEQRATHWMRFHSLKNYLNPDNIHETIEGYPAPKRAVFVCER